MRAQCLVGLFALVSLGVSHAQTPLLYAPFDGCPDAVIAAGDAQNLDPEQTYAPGIDGSAAVLSSDCRFLVWRNFNPLAGTLAAWIRPHWDGGDAKGHYIFCLYGREDLPVSWAMNRFSLSCAGGRCTFSIYTAQEGKALQLTHPIADWKADQWRHVAVTWENLSSGRADAALALYIDGERVDGLEEQAIDIGPTNDIMSIGRDQDASPDYGEADLDELFIYGRALSADEIRRGFLRTDLQTVEPQEAEESAARVVRGWWNPAWPYRARVVVPRVAGNGDSVRVQCPLGIGAEIAALGVHERVVPNSARVTSTDGEVAAASLMAGRLEWQTQETPAEFYIYAQTERYRVVGPLQAVRTAAIAPSASQAPPAADYATVTYGKPWDFDDGTFSGIAQWGDKPEYLRNRAVKDGILSMDVEQDPWFIWGDMWGQAPDAQAKVDIDLQRFGVLEMRVRQSVAQATWALYGRPGSSTHLLHHEFVVRGMGWQTVRIDLRQQARWRGTLSAFRIDPTEEVSAHIEIDWVRLTGAVSVAHEPTQTIGRPSAAAKALRLQIPRTSVPAGAAQELTVTVLDAEGRPVEGQPVLVRLRKTAGGRLARSAEQMSLEVSDTARRGLTDARGSLRVGFLASERAGEASDLLVAEAEFGPPLEARGSVTTVPGPPHHYRVEPARVVTLHPGDLPVEVSAQLVDAFDNPVAQVRPITWSTDEPGRLTQANGHLDAEGIAGARWQGVEKQRWVYHVTVEDGDGLWGSSAAICLLPDEPRADPIVLDGNGRFRKGPEGPVWFPLGGFYANWVGVPQGGEEGRRLVSFVEATEEQIAHWLEFLASQGVSAMRFMLRAHTPQGMEPMDLVGRVNMPLLAKVLRYMDLARKHDIRFMLTIHEDYTKPAYYNHQALETFCLPAYQDEDLDALPSHQRRFVRDQKLLGLIDEKYVDADAIACQDQYAQRLVKLLKDNPQLFAWEFENEMVDCPREWANHAAEVIRQVDAVTPICASHGGGGLHTADPLWWTRQTDIDFYTYHLYSHLGSTSEMIDYGAAVDVLTCYGRMAGVCMLGESAGDEFSRYPEGQDDDRRYIMRDIIWFSLVNGNPGCFFWNARGFEVEQFRLAGKIISSLDWRHWVRRTPQIGVVVTHPWEDDKHYRSAKGLADYAMMGRYAQHYLSAGVDFDFTMEAAGYAKTAGLDDFSPAQAAPYVSVGEGWQVRANARDDLSQGLAYVRNFAGVRHWQETEGRRRANMHLRDRRPAPLKLRLNLPHQTVSLSATDLDTGEEKRMQVNRDAEVDLGQSDHDWAVVWSAPR